MINNKVMFCIRACLFMLVCSLGMAESVLDNVDMVFGPRVGFTYVFIDVEAYTDEIHEIPIFDGERYVPFMSQFGISCEQRIRLGTTKSHFAFQEVVLIGGIDQSVAIPTIALLLGYRSEFGLELGLGPKWSLSGFNVVYAAGWTFNYQEVYVPVDIVFVPDIANGHHSVSLYTGFNFNLD
jgi:hypothetical protein